MNRIPLIYIASNGRSGSTLLDILLGLQPELWTMGEVHVLPWELREHWEPCGCGTRIDECAFWSEVLAELPAEKPPVPIEHFRTSHGSGKVLRWGLLPGLARGRFAPRQQAAIEAYGESNERFYRAVWKAASARRDGKLRWLVDASKDPYRLAWLQASGRFDIRVVHLVKDPRAFVYSMTKRELPHAPYLATRYALRWMIENKLFSTLRSSSFAPAASVCIRYEDLAQEPAQVLERLGDWLGTSFELEAPERFRATKLHGVSGNDMRWQDTGIKLDTRWHTGLPASYARSIWALTRPVRRQLGYS